MVGWDAIQADRRFQALSPDDQEYVRHEFAAQQGGEEPTGDVPRQPSNWLERMDPEEREQGRQALAHLSPDERVERIGIETGRMHRTPEGDVEPVSTPHLSARERLEANLGAGLKTAAKAQTWVDDKMAGAGGAVADATKPYVGETAAGLLGGAVEYAPYALVGGEMAPEAAATRIGARLAERLGGTAVRRTAQAAGTWGAVEAERHAAHALAEGRDLEPGEVGEAAAGGAIGGGVGHAVLGEILGPAAARVYRRLRGARAPVEAPAGDPRFVREGEGAREPVELGPADEVQPPATPVETPPPGTPGAPLEGMGPIGREPEPLPEGEPTDAQMRLRASLAGAPPPAEPMPLSPGAEPGSAPVPPQERLRQQLTGGPGRPADAPIPGEPEGVTSVLTNLRDALVRRDAESRPPGVEPESVPPESPVPPPADDQALAARRRPGLPPRPVAEGPPQRPTEPAPRGAILGKLFGDSPSTAALLERMVESPDDNVRNLTGALLDAAPSLARLKDQLAGGRVFKRDPFKAIATAVERASSLRSQGESIADHLANADMFGRDAAVDEVLRALDGMGRSKKRLGEFFSNVADVIDEAGDPGAPRLGGETLPEAPPLPELIAEAARRAREEYAGQTTLLGVGTKPKAGRPQPSGTMHYEPDEGPATSAPPPAVGAAAAETRVRRSEIIRELSEKLDVPIRVGHLGALRKSIRGVFKVEPEVIRTRLANDVGVASHEVGHALEKRNVVPRTLLEAHEAELLPIATKARVQGQELSEGFAEFIRMYISDPARAAAKAPRFLGEFEKTVGGDVKDVLLKARGDYRRWLDQPAVARVLSQISTTPDDVRPSLSVSKLYAAAVDNLEPLRAAVTEMEKREGALPFTKNPYIVARLFRGWTGRAEHFLERAPLRFGDGQPGQGPGLRQILAPVSAELDGFRTYLVSRRALELARRGKETGIAASDAREALAQLDSPRFREAATALQSYQEQTLRYLKDSGLITEGAYARMRAANQDYVPFYRVIEGAPGGRGGNGTTFADVFSPVHRLKGSARDIVDPLESIVRNTFAFVNLAERNRVARTLVEGRGEGLGHLVERLPTPTKAVTAQAEDIITALGKEADLTGKQVRERLSDALGIDLPDELLLAFRPSGVTPKDAPIVSVFQNGKPQLYQLHPELYRAMHAMDRESTGLLTRILAKPASWLRAGATLAPEFALRNPIRDQFAAFTQSKYGYVPGLDFFRGLGHAMKRDDVYWEFRRSGAAHANLVSLDRDYLQGELGRLIEDRTRRFGKSALRNPLEMLRAFSELTEEATRIGEFARGITQEGSSAEGTARAAYSSREATIDFSRIGAKTQALSTITAFWNARIQGVDRMVRAFKDDPGGATIKSVASITVPSVLLWAANHNDPRVQELPQWQRDLFWIVPVGEHLLRIPKPFELGIMFGSLPERMLDYAAKGDPAGMKRWATTFLGGMSPGMPIPTAAVPLIENLANWSLFRGRPIVPRGLEDVEPRYQDAGSSTLARKIGEAINYPPAKIENLIRGYTGGLGGLALDGVDSLAGEAGTAPARTIADWPAVRGFVARFPTSQAQSVEDFYEKYTGAERSTRTLSLLRKLDRNQAITYMRDHPELAQASRLRKAAEAISSYRKVILGLRGNAKLTPDEKRAAIDTTTLSLIDVARRALGRPGIRGDLLSTAQEKRAAGDHKGAFQAMRDSHETARPFGFKALVPPPPKRPAVERLRERLAR